ncbi:hypothetical protein [Thioalbus denitrificans]|uniref:Tetratricopeptide repeat protein n=1 Tax=Thioalbus denitrificans TaxID=547122 RepID=A0A369CNL4_9GAMM|nr:hypothetical protein [Thioalbus denitrificans]RCX33464.1 hypothetical protein DFQ59_101767 [Thioalbus denitrificans]
MQDASDRVFIGSLFFVCLVTIYIYWIGLGGPFLLDDFSSLELVKRYFPDPIAVALSRADQAGLPGRPVSMLSFILTAEDYPFDAWSFKYVNLCLHLITGLSWAWLLLIICRNSNIAFLRKSANLVALLGSAIWLLHPLNVSTVLYVVQRMTILSALFVILALIAFVYGKTTASNSKYSAAILLWIIYPFLLSLGVLSKENAVLGIPLTLLIDYFLIQSNRTDEPASFRRWRLIVVILPCALLVIKVLSAIPSYLVTYEIRDFSIWERLLTQSRVLILSLYNLVIPTSTSSSIFYDDIEISHSILSPATTLAAILFLGALLGSSIYFRKRAPMYAFCVLWFFIGHLLESSFIPLELYFEHRNYLPGMGISLLTASSLVFATRNISNSYFIFIVILATSVFAYSTHTNAKTWGDANALAIYSLYEHPDSVRATEFYVNRLTFKHKYNEAGRIISEALDRDKNNSGLILLQLYHECLHPETTGISPTGLKDAQIALNTSPLNLGAVGLAQQMTESVVSDQCQGVDNKDMHILLDSLLTNENFHKSRISMHNLYIAKSTLYADDRNLNKTMESIQYAIKSKDLIRTYYLAANILISAKRYDLALDFLQAALRRVQNRPWPLSSLYRDAIERYIRDIKNSGMSQEEQITNIRPEVTANLP